MAILLGLMEDWLVAKIARLNMKNLKLRFEVNNKQYGYSIMLFNQLSQTMLVVRYSMKVSLSVSSHIDIHDNFHGHSQYSNVNDRSNIIKGIHWNGSV